LDYLYDYYNEDAYDDDDSFTSLNSRNRPKLRQSGSRTKTSSSQNSLAATDVKNKNEDDFLADLPIVNQRENGVQFFSTPSSTNTRKSTTLTARDFPATRTNPFTDHNEFGTSENDGDDPPPLTTAKTDFPGQPTTPSPFVFGAKLARAKSRFANRFKLNRRKFLNDIKEKTGSIKFVNTKKNRARINDIPRRRPIQEEPEDYEDPEPRTTARNTLNTKFDPAPRPTRRPIPRRKFTETTTVFNDYTDPEPATTAHPPKGILNQAIAENKKRVKARILKQKTEITRAGIIPPPRKTILLNRKKALEAETAELEGKPRKEFKIIDAEELFDRLVEQNTPTTTTVKTTTSTTESAEILLQEHVIPNNVDYEQDVTQETSTTFSVPTTTATTLAPILENDSLADAEFVTINTDTLEKGSGHVLSTTSTNHNTFTDEPDYTIDNSSNTFTIELHNDTTAKLISPEKQEVTEGQFHTTRKQTTQSPSLVTKSVVVDSSPEPSSSILPKQTNNAQKSLGEILADLPKEKLEKFKQYLLTLNKEDKKHISKTLQNNLEASRKFSSGTTQRPNIDENNDAVIDLGILGSFRLEKPKRTIFEDELFDNRIRTERPSPVFKPQEHLDLIQ